MRSNSVIINVECNKVEKLVFSTFIGSYSWTKKLLIFLCSLCAIFAQANTFSPTNVVVAAEGLFETYDDFEENLRLAQALFVNKNPKVTDGQLNTFKRKIGNKVLMGMARRLTLEVDFGLTNVAMGVASAEMIARYERRFCRRGQNFESLIANLRKKGLENRLQSNMVRDSRLDQYLNLVFSNEVYASAEDYMLSTSRVQRLNARAMLTNACSVAAAQKVIAAYRNGKDFASLADAYSFYGVSCANSDEREVGGLIGEKVAVDFVDDPGVWETLNALKDGQCSDVITLGTGYAVYRVNKHITPEDSESGEPALSLSRVFFRRAYLFPKQTHEEFMRDLHAEKRENFLNKRVAEAAKRHHLRFPKGLKFSYDR